MTEKEIDRIAERVAALVLEHHGIEPDLVYRPIDAVAKIGTKVETDRAARRILQDFGIPTIPRSPGGKLRGVAGRDLIAHIERMRGEAA